MEEITRNFTEVYGQKQRNDSTVSGEAGNWIADLFTPAFACTVEDVLEGKTDDDVTDIKIRGVPAFDPNAIQEVYHKVRLMRLMDEAMQKQKLKKISEPTLKIKEKDVPGSPTDITIEVKDDSPNNDSTNDIEKSAIWDSEELSVLRQVFKSTKGQISNVKVKLRETEARNSFLEDIVKKQEHAIDKNDMKLTEATKCNKRLQIHCDNLQHQLDHSGAKLDTVTEMWKEIDQEKSKMMKEIQEFRLAHDKERLLRENLELKLEYAMCEKQRAIDIAVQNTKVMYEKQIYDLQQERKEIADEYFREKQTYSVTSKALSHLRHHFASLPVDNIIPPNAVVKDEVSDIDHVS